MSATGFSSGVSYAASAGEVPHFRSRRPAEPARPRSEYDAIVHYPAMNCKTAPSRPQGRALQAEGAVSGGSESATTYARAPARKLYFFARFCLPLPILAHFMQY